MLKKTFYLIFALAICSLIVVPIFSSRAANLAQQLNGYILLQVQANGEAWYVYPQNDERYFLGTPAQAFQVMRQLGLGISQQSYNQFVRSGVPARLSGMILINVDDAGKAYYVYPKDLSLNYLGSPTMAFQVMRSLGLGISNSNLATIPISPNSPAIPGPAPIPPICTPNCSAGANYCIGQTYSDGCGGLCAGQANCCTPNCSCAANTCQGSSCSNGCGGLCSGTKVCGNPADIYCTQNGGQLVNQNGYNGTYGVCVFADNRQCEEWAMYNGQCRLGGIKITGYNNNQQIYCAITGGTVNMNNSTCTLYNGRVCTITGYWQNGSQCTPYNPCIADCSCAATTCTGYTCSDGCGGLCQGQKNCCTPNCSCAANTCIGKTCSNGCGGTCQGQKSPNCSCAANTCQGDTCSDGCGGQCQGTKVCGNPASVYCSQHDGQVIEKSNPQGQYGVCTFEDNRQCEEWAMYNGKCPIGGLKVTGWDNEQQIYCAITGNTVNMDHNTCTLSNKTCSISDYWNNGTDCSPLLLGA